MALFRNLGVNQSEADKTAELLVPIDFLRFVDGHELEVPMDGN